MEIYQYKKKKYDLTSYQILLFKLHIFSPKVSFDQPRKVLLKHNTKHIENHRNIFYILILCFKINCVIRALQQTFGPDFFRYLRTEKKFSTVNVGFSINVLIWDEKRGKVFHNNIKQQQSSFSGQESSSTLLLLSFFATTKLSDTLTRCVCVWCVCVCIFVCACVTVCLCVRPRAVVCLFCYSNAFILVYLWARRKTFFSSFFVEWKKVRRKLLSQTLALFLATNFLGQSNGRLHPAVAVLIYNSMDLHYVKFFW